MAVYNEEKEEVTVFAVNRNLEEDLELDMDMRSFAGYKGLEHLTLHSHDLKLCNSAGEEKIIPCAKAVNPAEQGVVSVVLERGSWNVIRFGKK